MIRAIIIAATISTIYCLWLDQPKPVTPVQVDYCVIDMHVAAKDDFGQWHTGWTKGYGPCSLLDRYENA